MGKIIAINASPRTKWNTAQLVREAAQGVADAGNEIEVIDLYSLEPFMGCRSCFACKLERSYGVCAIRDGLFDTLAKLRGCDGIILGTPNYFGRPTAGFRALLERLCFQYLTYRREDPSCNTHRVPVLFIMTSNASAERYEQMGYNAMIEENTSLLERQVGPVSTFIAPDTLQTDHYERFNWTMFDAEAKKARHEEVFPQELAEVHAMAEELFA